MTRTELLNLIYNAHSQEQIDEAYKAIDSWLEVHPDDHVIRGTAEMLIRTEEALVIITNEQ